MSLRISPKIVVRTLLVVALLLGANVSFAQIGPGPFAAFPTADPTDARFLGFSCEGLNTFEDGVSIGVEIPIQEADFTLSIFDGDTGAADGGGLQHWDLGNRQLLYSLYTDPLGEANEDAGNLVATWTGNDPNPLSGPGWTVTSAQMPDNDWWGATVDTSAAAQSPSGNYNYHLRIAADGACGPGEQLESNIKVAASNPLSFAVPRFGIVGAMRQIPNDARIIYPGGFPSPDGYIVDDPTTYDGTFEFSLSLPPNSTDLRIFGGDFDHGTVLLASVPFGIVLQPCLDDDDPDTPADYAGFPFDVGSARPEAAYLDPTPADDNHLDLFRRGEPGQAENLGCVRYELIDPNGVVYRNDNPSGGQEWEQFRIAAALADDPGLSDFQVSDDYLPAGVWDVRIIGLDLGNLNFLFLEAGACANVDGEPACVSRSLFLLGDTVFLDGDGDGMLDAGEAGIAGVEVELRDGAGNLIETAVTGDTSSPNWANCVANNTGNDTQGLYCFGVSNPGDYSVVVASSNFASGGALEGLASTSGGDQIDDTLVDANVLTYDFGYAAPAPVLGSIGDRVWLDEDGDGQQDAGEPGINGVTVELLDDGGTVIDTTVTSGDGNYLFSDLPPGTYTVRVDATTLPAGLAQTYDLDGLASRHQATIDLDEGEDRVDLDFGYAPCGECEGKVTRLTFEYQGGGTANVKIKAKRGPSTDVVFDATLEPGDVFEVVGPASGNGGFAGTLGTEIKFYVDGSFHAQLHTSCSVEIGPGTVAGDFEVLAGASKHGGALCPLDGDCTDCGGGDCVTQDLDFETDRSGGPVERGTLAKHAFSGVTITTHDSRRYPAMIFDSANPTGGDWDLGTPNQAFDGPGRGQGGAGGAFANEGDEGNVLIISEDGHHWDPDDRARGGWLYFVFDEPVHIESVGILDVENSRSKVYAYDADWNRLAKVNIPVTGNNGKVTVSVDSDGVKYLKVYFQGSGAVTRVSFCPDDEGGGGGSDVGTGTIGYWKNHASAWPLDSVMVGPYHLSQSYAIQVLGWSTSDLTIRLAKQLVATKLNLANGTEASCIEDAVAAADAFIAEHPPGDGLSSSERAEGEALKDTLDDYNNGRLCAPHRG